MVQHVAHPQYSRHHASLSEADEMKSPKERRAERRAEWRGEREKKTNLRQHSGGRIHHTSGSKAEPARINGKLLLPVF